ncbi:hypothetical protein D9757_010632 [Collybiopsis confluens]|uniref:Uncharacterized protein n=1 Tax=Collybiopsis confluens TaxID=2823264 RepID=A0A8H5GSU3_9AGAR|nr:hypothetical protein D9757_010632 [Collybiopsis confluens]
MPLYDIYQVSQDIRVFLIDGFSDILIRHSDLMQHVPHPWPTSDQIEYFVQKSSGQFIYASTVLRYIDTDGDVPADRLDIVLGLRARDDEDKEQPFAELDALYLQILFLAKNPSLLRKILAVSYFWTS